MPYVYRNTPEFVPYAYMAHTQAARAMLPTFPFWRAALGQPWGTPPDGGNPLLAQLNARPIPADVRLYSFFGSMDSGGAGVALDVRLFVLFGSLDLEDAGGTLTMLGVTGESGGAECHGGRDGAVGGDAAGRERHAAQRTGGDVGHEQRGGGDGG